MRIWPPFYSLEKGMLVFCSLISSLYSFCFLFSHRCTLYAFAIHFRVTDCGINDIAYRMITSWKKKFKAINCIKITLVREKKIQFTDFLT